MEQMAEDKILDLQVLDIYWYPGKFD